MKTKKYFILSGSLMLLFIVFTILVKFVNASAIGPNGSVVGFSTFNGWFHDLTGVHLSLYNVTDYVQYIAVAIGLVYAVVGLVQWIKRKSIKKVDSDILWLGAFYIVVLLVYLAFEFIKINYRPVLIDGQLEVSYPSSTTVLSITFLLTSIHFSNKYIKNNLLKKIAKYTTLVLMSFLVVGRIISGVHWATDIIASAIISSSLVLLYYGAIKITSKNDVNINTTADKDEEKLEVLDDKGNFTGKQESRGIIHSKQIFHNEIALWIIDTKNRKVLVQRRSKNKKQNPNKIALCAGHVVFPETIEEALKKEASEELGIDIENYKVYPLGIIKREEINNHCFSHHFYIKKYIPTKNMTIQNEELSEVFYMDYNELKTKIKNQDQEIAIKWSDEIKKIFDLLDKIIG